MNKKPWRNWKLFDWLSDRHWAWFWRHRNTIFDDRSSSSQILPFTLIPITFSIFLTSVSAAGISVIMLLALPSYPLLPNSITTPSFFLCTFLFHLHIEHFCLVIGAELYPKYSSSCLVWRITAVLKSMESHTNLLGQLTVHFDRTYVRSNK